MALSITPRLQTGALVGLDLFNPLASVIRFQYNPATMTRKLDAQTQKGTDGDRTEALRLTGPPVETITLKIELDGTDPGTPLAAQSASIYPQLSALEILLYPKSSLLIANTALLAAGTIEVTPAVAPFTLFVWGPKRVLPVRLESFSIEEQQFGPNLEPVQAEVSLSLRVLSTSDFAVSHPGYHIFLAHQVVKETLATLSSASAAAAGAAELPLDVKLGI